MKSEVIAERYAQALLSVAKDKNLAEAIRDQIGRYEAAASSFHEMAHFLQSPRIAEEKKEGLIARLFEGEARTVLSHFIRLLLRKGRIGYLDQIFRLYPKLYDAERGVLRGELRSAYPLDSEVMNRLKAKLESQIHRKLELTLVEDRQLLGGFVFSTGTTMIDASVQRELANLREQMKLIPIP